MNKDREYQQSKLQPGVRLANPAPGDEVVIAGMSGRFPSCKNVYQFQDNLLKKVSMMNTSAEDWKAKWPELPPYLGKIPDAGKFDAEFFGVEQHQAHAGDPMCRKLLECAFEAVVDAGVHPSQLRGSRTAAIVCTTFKEVVKPWFDDNAVKYSKHGVMGAFPSLLAQKISYFFELVGPSYAVDSACSSSLTGLEFAYREIREGKCDSALVCGSSLCLHPLSLLEYAMLGVLSPHASTKCFDENADGYSRSEAVVAVFLQKAKNAKRIYAQIVHAKCDSDGFKEQGITFISSESHTKLIDTLYEECNVDPASVEFLECHSTGTRVGDLEELNSVKPGFCKGRKFPLRIGSVKSVMGHSEPASGLCSVVKVIMGMENECFVPNIGFNVPRKGVEVLESGEAVVVTEVTPWPRNRSGLAGINGFGIGGAKCHVLLKRFDKQKVDGGQPGDDLPRLVCVSGRTEASIEKILDDISGKALDEEFVRLLHEVFGYNIAGHVFRGYIVISKTGELERSSRRFGCSQRPLRVIFGGPESNLLDIVHKLPHAMVVPTLEKIKEVCLPREVTVEDILGSPSEGLLPVIFGSIVVQMVVVDLLSNLEVPVDYIEGYSTGVLTTAYADGVLSLEEVVCAAYYVGTFLETSTYSINNIDDALNAFKSVKHQYKHIETPALMRENDFSDLGKKLLHFLKQVIRKGTPRTQKWANAKGDVSAEFILSNILRPSKDVEMADLTHSVNLKVGRAGFTDNKNPLIQLDSSKCGVMSFLNVIGRLYELGWNPRLEKLYPKVKWPVSARTPMISPLIEWNHSIDWYVPQYSGGVRSNNTQKAFIVDIKEDKWGFIADHNIDGSKIVPSAAYISMVWETLAAKVGKPMADIKVVFEDVSFQVVTFVSSNKPIKFTVAIQESTGKFEVEHLDQEVACGKIYLDKDFADDYIKLIGSTDEVTLTREDAYRELKLRGYNYTGVFQGITQYNLHGSFAFVEWSNNWAAFIDSALQLTFLQRDTRKLLLPVGIARLSIDAKKHLNSVDKLQECLVVPVCACKEANVIKSGGITVTGLQLREIQRLRSHGNPILSTYKFVPLEEHSLSLEQSVFVHVQLVVENLNVTRIRVLEMVDEYMENTENLLAPIINKALLDEPLVQPDIVVLSKKTLSFPGNITVENKSVAHYFDCSLIIASNISNKAALMHQAVSSLRNEGFVLSREDADFDPASFEGVDVVSTHHLKKESLILLRKKTVLPILTVIDISKPHEDFSWLEILQKAISENKNVFVFAQNDSNNGIIGLVNCLRLEPGGSSVKCVFIRELAPPFDINHPFFVMQLKKGLVINIFQDKKWGTYRHLPLDLAGTVKCEHIFNDVAIKGDLASLRWIEGPLKDELGYSDDVLVNVHYASLNYKDVMIASSLISADDIKKDRTKQEILHGFEFSGVDKQGHKLMGIINGGGLASMVLADRFLTWEIPKGWTMEDASTVPVVYATVLTCLIQLAKIKCGQTILVHAGTGGVGQATINVAHHFGCQIFTTTSTNKKRNFIRQNFPFIPDSHIGNSRDTSFEHMVLELTKGRGVDVVINSSSEGKLTSSLRCLARGGMFLDIGRYDMEKNNQIGLKPLSEGRKYCSVMLDDFISGPRAFKVTLNKLIREGLEGSYIKPLVRTVFNSNKIEDAFRYMATAKHIGKVVVKMLELENCNGFFEGLPRFYCRSEESYIIIGGLGGIGLELTDWLILRGVKKVLLVSRSGITIGYQHARIRLWQTQYGAEIKILRADASTVEACMSIISQANELAPVGGIFNLAVVLNDGIFTSQNKSNFIASLAPKALTTQHLDKLSRLLCPELRYFVVFSSVSCGRGNAGQTNYGMANSAMERICEQRRRDGYPGLAIQWGAIREVGLAADMIKSSEKLDDAEVANMGYQTIASCLEAMDIFLRSNETIVSSIVINKKNVKNHERNIVEDIKAVMGFRNLTTVSPHTPLSELGMDSITSLDINQILRRNYNINLAAPELRALTLAKLQSMVVNDTKEALDLKSETVGFCKEELFSWLQFNNDEANSETPLKYLQSKIKENANAPTIFMVPGINGITAPMKAFARKIQAHVYCVKFLHNEKEEFTIDRLAMLVLPMLLDKLDPTSTFTLVGYSYGCTLVVHLASLLESRGYIGKLILINGSLALFKALTAKLLDDTKPGRNFETNFLLGVTQNYFSKNLTLEQKNNIFTCPTFEQRIDLLLSYVPGFEDNFKQKCTELHDRLKAIFLYNPSFAKLKSHPYLFKVDRKMVEEVDNCYGVQEFFEMPVQATTFIGDHLSIIENQKVVDGINNIINQ